MMSFSEEAFMEIERILGFKCSVFKKIMCYIYIIRCHPCMNLKGHLPQKILKKNINSKYLIL